jgi:hypothetical protein
MRVQRAERALFVVSGGVLACSVALLAHAATHNWGWGAFILGPAASGCAASAAIVGMNGASGC